MKKTARTVLAACVAAMCAAECAATPEGFGVDFAAAVKRAGESGRSVFAFFTGSDWCPWCVRLVDEVLSKPAFLDVATNEYELVEIDFPRDRTKQTDERRAANAALAERYGVEGYPTVLLLDAKGKVIYKSGYAQGGAAKWIADFREGAAAAPLVEKHLGGLIEETESMEGRFRSMMRNSRRNGASWDEAIAAIGKEVAAMRPEMDALRERLAAAEVPPEISKRKSECLGRLDRMIETAKHIMDVVKQNQKSK
jgi:thioredoxin-related protein